MRAVIATFKLAVFALTAFVTIAIQSTTLLFCKGRLSYVYPRLYYAFLCRLFGVRVLVDGAVERSPGTIYVGNHLSYLDILAVGGVVEGSFVAKADVERWPFFGLMAKQQQTVFVSRDRAHAARETRRLLERVERGTSLIIFPEGTSSNGAAVLPFKSSFFDAFVKRDLSIQPFTISLLETDGVAAAVEDRRDRYAWHGDMTLEPHIWAFARSRGATLRITFHPSLMAGRYDDRKALSADAYRKVSEGLDLSVAVP